MKHTYRLFLSFSLVVLCLATGFLLIKYSITATSADRIADEILRLHVIANSDSAEDQTLKLKVKEALLDELNEASVQSLEEMTYFVSEHQADLLQTAEAVLAAEDCHFPVRIELGTAYFPTKSYGDLTFPCGDYQALRIIIGDGAGQNWWCVLYPPLCFTDLTTGIVPDKSKETLAQTLTDEDYQSLTGAPVTFRFRLLDWLRSRLP